MNGFLMPVFDQIDFVCDLIKNDPELKDGYHAVGFRKVEKSLILNVKLNNIRFNYITTMFKLNQSRFAVFARCSSEVPKPSYEKSYKCSRSTSGEK